MKRIKEVKRRLHHLPAENGSSLSFAHDREEIFRHIYQDAHRADYLFMRFLETAFARGVRKLRNGMAEECGAWFLTSGIVAVILRITGVL